MTLRSLSVLLRYALSLWLAGAATLALALPEPRLPREGLCLNNLYQGTLDKTQARLFLASDGASLLGMVELLEGDEQNPAVDLPIYPRRWYSGTLSEDGRFELAESDSDGRVQGPAAERLTGGIDAEGVLTGDRQRAGEGPAPLRFQPTDTIMLGQAPPLRLRLEPTPEGIDWGAKAWLVIGDGPETLVTDSRGAAAAPCIGREPHEARADHLNPDSLSVRPLPSDPPVYWIRYEIRGATGSSQGLERRHLVVRVDAQPSTIFNEWSQEYSGGSQGFDRHQSVDYRVEAQGTTLSIIATTLGGEESDMGDCGLCAYAHEDCQSFCEYFGFGCIDHGGGKGVHDCEEQCRRNCERDDYVANCLARKTTLKQWSRQRHRRIDARTGQVLTDARTEVGEYLTGWYRCGAEKSRHFLVLDDGRAAWLLVRDAPAEPLPRPGPAAALPAMASCWLFNRGAGSVAEGPGPYPPAAPDQMRPGVAPPAGCCVVETEASGRLTRVFARQDPEDDGDASDRATRGRLLAVFDAQSGHCLSADLIADGPLGQALRPAVAPEERIALASAIRRRVAPDPEAEEIISYSVEAGQEVAQRLALGTPVLTLGRSALTAGIDGVEDHWY